MYMQAPNGEVFETDTPEYHKEAKRITAKLGKELQKQAARDKLREILKPGMTVHTTLRHCSRSGMQRSIALCVSHDGEVTDISWLAARAMNDTIDHKNGGIKIGGCGMDMGFALVYNLGYALWPNGTPEPHGKRNGEPDSAGGYALKHRWL